MDQIKIGKFIAQQRKNKQLTQQALADKLEISNKTISKWECGNGLPDISLLLPLCNALDISVNELLSAELLNVSYKEKAEENLLSLYQDQEILKSKNLFIKKLIGFSFILSFILWLFIFSDSNIYQFGHIPTPLTLCYLIIGFVFINVSVFVISYFIFHKK